MTSKDPQTAAAFDAISHMESDMGSGDRSQFRKLKKLAKTNPMSAIRTVLDEYAGWMNYEAFPFSYSRIAGDGQGDESRENKIDREPTEEFKATFGKKFYTLTDGCQSDVRRYLLIQLAMLGVDPRSVEWLDGAEARCRGIPRLGRTGDWGRGWLFADSCSGWEGAKSHTGPQPSAPLSPSEWRWALEAGLVAGPWRNHGGGWEWDWQALADSTEARNWGGTLLDPTMTALYRLAERLTTGSDEGTVNAMWTEVLRNNPHINGGRYEPFFVTTKKCGVLVFGELGFVAAPNGEGATFEVASDWGHRTKQSERWAVVARPAIRLRSGAIAAHASRFQRKDNITDKAEARSVGMHIGLGIAQETMIDAGSVH